MKREAGVNLRREMRGRQRNDEGTRNNKENQMNEGKEDGKQERIGEGISEEGKGVMKERIKNRMNE